MGMDMDEPDCASYEASVLIGCSLPWAEDASNEPVAVFEMSNFGGVFFLLFWETDDFLLCADRSAVFKTPVCCACFATGHDKPRNFPLLATPTPHVNVVLYPEHSFPISRHCPQYGLFRSHFTWRLRHAKQSSVAPVAAVLLLLLRGTAAAFGSAEATFADEVISGAAMAHAMSGGG